jgi:hypothetical protein
VRLQPARRVMMQTCKGCFSKENGFTAIEFHKAKLVNDFGFCTLYGSKTTVASAYKKRYAGRTL